MRPRCRGGAEGCTCPLLTHFGQASSGRGAREASEFSVHIGQTVAAVQARSFERHAKIIDPAHFEGNWRTPMRFAIAHVPTVKTIDDLDFGFLASVGESTD